MQEEIVSKQKVDNSTEEQKKFIELPKEFGSVLLRSIAGSGKSYSCVKKMENLIEQGVSPERMIFFSFTKAAVEELKRRINNDKIHITTIHSFCARMLGRMKKMKKIVTIYDFINWFKEKHKPKYINPIETEKYKRVVEELYENADRISAEISSFKLQSADNIKCKLPDYWKEYCDFLKQTKSLDFSDMLIVVRDALKEDKWLKLFKGHFDYIFVDEYQDTSTIQMQILLSLNAKHYFLVGDEFQAIYGFGGANCKQVEALLKRRRNTEEMSLSINFRSAPEIVENSNKYSNLKGTAFHKYEGKVHKQIILFEQLKNMFNGEQMVVLCRTNSVIRDLERRLLELKTPIKYFNYIKPEELIELERGQENEKTKQKIKGLLPYFDNSKEQIIKFIRDNQDSENEVRSIHRSKGLEYDNCVIVNSFSPEIMEINKLNDLDKNVVKILSFDPADEDDVEARNVHYVAVSRAKKELYFMYYEL